MRLRNWAVAVLLLVGPGLGCMRAAPARSEAAAAAVAGSAALAPLRPPAVPLVACDPYFSIWSNADRLTDDATRHWTRRPHRLVNLIRVDGASFRLMGDQPRDFPALPQVSVQVLPTRSIYEFASEQVAVTLTFLTPALPDELDVLARPLTYLTWDVRSRDGRPHAVGLYFSAAGEIAVDAPTQAVTGGRQTMGDLLALRLGSADQPVLAKQGDDRRVDWGYLYAAAPQATARAALGWEKVCSEEFLQTGKLPAADDARFPRRADEQQPVAAFAFDLGEVGAQAVSRHLLLAYDDEYSILYFGQKLRPYWRRGGMQAADLLQAAERDYERLQTKCAAFDRELVSDLAQVGGVKYARLAALAYRECLAGNKLAADSNGQPLLFPKENTSNGCIATVDVIYPMAPLFLLMSPSLAKASVANNLCYAASDRWKWPFAPHDLGCYPRAMGQVYGGGERTEQNQMPVEESGNMILLLAAIAKIEGNASFASAYWPVVTKWAQYLEAKGFDPENQLCTDDFAGHLAHNANLSIKAIAALAAYGQLCDLRGDKATAARYQKLAQSLAAKWMDAALDGDHYRLAFDRPGTWSQKYNLVWDRILGLNLFPAKVVEKEMLFYRTKLDRFGLPLDNRKAYAKTDWTLWTAALAPDRDDFDLLVNPVYDMANQTNSRVALSDFYWTKDARDAGMHARPVIGGVFIPMLTSPTMWAKWAKRDTTHAANWAPLPTPPKVTEVVPTARREGATWRYTTDKPAGDWFKPDFDASSWKEGPAGFGTAGTPGAIVRTTWKTDDIWLRREFTLAAEDVAKVQLCVHHDEDVEVYLNGVLAGSAPGFISDYELMDLSPAARAALKPGKNVLAVHCHQTQGGQYVDVGLVTVTAAKAGGK